MTIERQIYERGFEPCHECGTLRREDRLKLAPILLPERPTQADYDSLQGTNWPKVCADGCVVAGNVAPDEKQTRPLVVVEKKPARPINPASTVIGDSGGSEK